MYTKQHGLMFLSLVAVDQFTKWAANTFLDYFQSVVIFPWLQLSLVHNPGAAWGIFAHRTFLLTGVSVAVLIVLWFMRYRLGTNKWTRWGLVILAAGTFGNLIDRMAVGYVTDFVNIGIIPVFNIADILINVGVFGLLIESFIHGNSDPST
jgi:signal peptidase II